MRVSEIPVTDLQMAAAEKKGESSATVRARAIMAREKQSQRLANTHYLTNSEINSGDARQLCQLTVTAERLLQQAAQCYHFSVRSYFKIIKVARTIADLMGEQRIEPPAIAEAIQYRLDLGALPY